MRYIQIQRGCDYMPRNRREIDPECGRRLKSLFIKHNIVQYRLAEKINCVPQHLSNVVCGKRQLTPELAQRIVHEAFPHVNVDWLLNRSEFETVEEKERNAAKKWEERLEIEKFHDRVFRAFIDGIEDLCGYGLHSQGTDLDYIVVSNSTGKKVGVIPAEDFKTLRGEIENFASYSINLLIKNKMEDLPKSEMDGDNNG